MQVDATADEPPKLVRRNGGRVIGGVAGGLADHLGVDVFRVRVVFVLLGALAGAGVAAYVLLWFLCPLGDDAERVSPAERRQAYGLALVGLVVSMLVGIAAAGTPLANLLPFLVVLVGAGVVWREFDAPVDFDHLLAQASPDIQAMFRDSVLPGAPHAVAESRYAAARDVHLPALRRLFREFFARQRLDAMVLPATMIAAPRIGEDVSVTLGARTERFDVAIARNISPASTAGIPGLVLPAGLSRDGLPVSLEFDAPAGSDRRLLGLAAALEAALGRLPPPVI